MSHSNRKHLFSKYLDSPRSSWKKGKKDAHRYNRNRCRQSLRNGEEPLPDLPLNWFDWDYIKIFQGKGHRYYCEDYAKRLRRKQASESTIAFAVVRRRCTA